MLLVFCIVFCGLLFLSLLVHRLPGELFSKMTLGSVEDRLVVGEIVIDFVEMALGLLHPGFVRLAAGCSVCRLVVSVGELHLVALQDVAVRLVLLCIEPDVIALLEELVLLFLFWARLAVIGGPEVAEGIGGVLQPFVVLAVAGHAELALGIVVKALLANVYVGDCVEPVTSTLASKGRNVSSLLGLSAALLARGPLVVPAHD